MKKIMITPEILARDLAHYRMMFDCEYDSDKLFVKVNDTFVDYTPMGVEMYQKYYNNFLLIIEENEEKSTDSL